MLKLLDKFIRKIQPEWKSIDQLARRYEKKFVDAYMTAITALRNSVDVKSLQHYELKDMGNFINYSHLDTDEMYVITGLLIRDAMEIADEYLPLKVLQHPGHRSFKARHDIKKRAGVAELGSFNMRNPMAVEWSVSHTGEMIKEVTASTQSAVQQIITTALQEGGHPYETAREIRQMIGLTENQMKSVSNYQEKLLSEGTRSGKAVDAMVDSFVNGKIRDRAEVIARTETITAACQGQQLHWNQMVQEGLIDKTEMEKVWIATPDDRVCEECSGMDGEATEIDGVFSSGDNTPAAHPDCRCAIGLQEKELSTKELDAILNEPEEVPAINEPEEVPAINQPATEVPAINQPATEVPELEIPDEWKVKSLKDVRFGDAINAQTKKLYQLYPEIASVLKKVEIKSYKEMVFFSNTLRKSSGCTVVQGNNNFRVLIRDYTSKEVLERQKHEEDVKWHPSGTSTALASTLTHEFGHVVDFWIRDNLPPVNLDFYAKEIDALFADPVPDKGLENSTPEQKMKYGLSEYAMADTLEMVAVAFEEYYYSPSPRPMAIAVMEVIGKYLKIIREDRVKAPASTLRKPKAVPSLMLLEPMKPKAGHSKKLKEGDIATQREIWNKAGMPIHGDMYEMVNAVDRWTYHGDAAIRAGKDPDNATLLEKYIAASPSYDGVLYRGISVTEDVLTQFEKGRVIDMHGVSSFSSSKKVALDFTQTRQDKIGIIFRVPEVEQSTSIAHLSQFPGEKEVLVSENAKFEIVSVKEKNGTTYIDLKEVQEPSSPKVVKKSIGLHEHMILYCKYLQKKYPVEKNINVKFGTIDDHTWALTNSATCSILFNYLYFQSNIEVAESIQEATEIGWHPIIKKGLEAESIVAHEYGHVLYAQKIKNTIFETAILAIWNIYKKNPIYFASSLSIYATKDPGEMFAECLSDACAGMSCTMTRQVVQIIKEVYSDAAYEA